jgi:hypothetical protein
VGNALGADQIIERMFRLFSSFFGLVVIFFQVVEAVG